MKYIEKSISNFIETQFPAIYREEGPQLVEFVKSYFEWLESSDNVLYKTRRLFDYRDLDSTLDEYIIYFKNKYAKNIPLNIKADKRLLLKNIQDLYKTKGSELSFEIFFRTVYGKTVKIYYPGDDILRVSDGEWYEKKYLEITSFIPNIQEYVGKKIAGINSGAQAVVEQYYQTSANRKIVDILEITNLQGTFDYGEPIRLVTNNSIIGKTLPTTTGSLSAVSVIDGGANFNIGDILDVQGKGKNGKVKVVNTTEQRGRVSFNLESGGTGYSLNALSLVSPQLKIDYVNATGNIQAGQLLYTIQSNNMVANGTIISSNASTIIVKQNTSGFIPGSNAYTALKMIVSPSSGSFTNGEIVYQSNGTANVAVGQILRVIPNIANTGYFIGNVIGNFQTSVYNSSGNTFVLVGNTSSAQGFIFTIEGGSNTGTITISNTVGGGTGASFKIGDITDREIVTVNSDYLRDKINTKFLTFNESANAVGTVSVTDNSNTVTGVGTTFTTTFIPGSYIQVSNTTSKQIREISTIANNTSLTTVQNFSNTQSNVPYYVDTSNYGFIKQVLSEGEKITSILKDALTYNELEIGKITRLTSINPGTGYSLNPFIDVVEPLIAALNQPGENGKIKGADAIVTAQAGTNIGVALGLEVVSSGVGFEQGENITMSKTSSPFSAFGSAIIKTHGREQGYWRNTKGFLSSDKFIQDSKYYQEYSYEVQVDVNFDQYKQVVFDLLHTAGTELFGLYRYEDNINVNVGVETSSITSS